MNHEETWDEVQWTWRLGVGKLNGPVFGSAHLDNFTYNAPNFIPHLAHSLTRVLIWTRTCSPPFAFANVS